MTSKDTYQGFTFEQLNNKLTYDPVEGKFYNKKSGKLIDSTKNGRPYIGIRVVDRVVTLQPSRVALILTQKMFLEEGDVITLKDGDVMNLRLDNFVVVKLGDIPKGMTYVEEPYSIATETKGVFKVMPKGFFVARRGPKQAVYRTNSYEEAVKIRKEWEKDKTIHHWDHTTDMSYILAKN